MYFINLLDLAPLITVLINSVGSVSYLLELLIQSGQAGSPFGLDLSIESLRSQKYSIGIFVFLIISLILFAVIIYIYLPKGKKKLKTGEKIMFGAIILGMVAAIFMGWLQLIDGYLL